MKKYTFLIVTVLLLSPINTFARSGCCSHHGGVTNSLNYNSNANKDDGSCIRKVECCMNPAAINYSKDANVSNGTCQFEKTETTTKKIKYKTKYIYNKYKKNKSVKRKGKNGIKEVQEKIITKEAGEEISTKVIKKAVNKQVYTRNKTKK